MSLPHPASHKNEKKEQHQMDDRTCKIVLVGDNKCGKTALIERFIKDDFNPTYTPTGFERCSADCEVGDQQVYFTVWDTSGSPTYDTVRPLAYQDAKVFLLCFHIAMPVSLENAVNKWRSEIRRFCPSTPIILCGCCSDLRCDSETIYNLSNQKKSPVTAEEAIAASRQIGATTYVETSSKQCGKSVHDAFEVAALAAMGKLNKNRHLLTLTKSKKNKKLKQNKNKSLLRDEIRVKAGHCTIL